VIPDSHLIQNTQSIIKQNVIKVPNKNPDVTTLKTGKSYIHYLNFRLYVTDGIIGNKSE
jgi:hypothetical protein